MALGTSEGGLQAVALIALFIVQVYCLMKVYSNLNEKLLRNYLWLGPFALMISGVLSCRGRTYLIAFMIASALLFLTATLVFDL